MIKQQIIIMGDNKKLGFAENFMLAGVAAGVSKTFAAPIERIKLLVQNQDEMIKQGRLDKPYKGVVDCASRVLKTEGVYPFWRGNLANVLRYFPPQALNFAFKDGIKAMFATPKDASSQRKFATNIASGGKLPLRTSILGGGKHCLDAILEGKVKSLGGEVSEHVGQVSSPERV